MRMRLRQYIAIQAVPSAWLIKPPVGKGALRSNTPMLSSPRKPPWKMLWPCPPLRFTHQVKFKLNLCRMRSRKARSRPVRVAAVPALRRRGRLGRIACEPFRHIVVKELRGPDHAGERLALHATCVRIGELGLPVGIEFVGLSATKREHLVEIGEWRVEAALEEAKANGC